MSSNLVFSRKRPFFLLATPACACPHADRSVCTIILQRRMQMQIHYRGHNLSIEIVLEKMRITACRAQKNMIRIGYKETIHKLDEGQTLEIMFQGSTRKLEVDG